MNKLIPTDMLGEELECDHYVVVSQWGRADLSVGFIKKYVPGQSILVETANGLITANLTHENKCDSILKIE